MHLPQLAFEARVIGQIDGTVGEPQQISPSVRE
eukprot:SAG31_NODE_19945_length_588_cov_0.619632_2_plen_32_part_01